MTPQEMANRRAELLKKRWAGDASSEEQDEIDELTDALRILAAQWRAPQVQASKVTA